MSTADSTIPHEQTPLIHPSPNTQPSRSAQSPQRTILRNLTSGTAPLSQFGAILLTIVVFSAIIAHNPTKLPLFSLHPLLNILSLLISLQAILILQPTNLASPAPKAAAAKVHAIIWSLSITIFFAGLIMIEIHKRTHGIGHFESPHAVLGVVVYGLVVVQGGVGVVQYWVPGLVGGVENGKKIYKWHRVAGYAIFSLMVVNVILASRTRFAGKVLGIKTWSVAVAGGFVLLGLLPRIKKEKVILFRRADHY